MLFEIVVALFNLMGIWPIIYACVLLADGRGQKVRSFPFVIGSFAVGAFAILPYLAWREPNPKFIGEKDWILNIFDSRIIGIVLSILTAVLLSYALSNGNWSDFSQQWQESQFIPIMSLDFCLLCLLFPTVLGDDLARRGSKSSLLFWLVALIPLVGPLMYLCFRPQLLSSKETGELT
jgi:drug/metabolite transporter (DMT)-like permease